MEVRCIGFVPPMEGMEGEFNTFRMGGTLFRALKPGDVVFLLDEKKKVVFGRAEVVELDNGPLMEMCILHGARNHTQLSADKSQASIGILQVMQKIYGPHIAQPSRNATVIYLRRLE